MRTARWRRFTCLGTSRLLCVFMSAPVGVRDRVKVVRKRCMLPQLSLPLSCNAQCVSRTETAKCPVVWHVRRFQSGRSIWALCFTVKVVVVARVLWFVLQQRQQRHQRQRIDEIFEQRTNARSFKIRRPRQRHQHLFLCVRVFVCIPSARAFRYV